jgi:hypothetical protein
MKVASNDEIEYENMPDLIDPISEEILDDKILKSKFPYWFDYTSAPSGPIKEMSIDDSSKLVLLKLDDRDIDQHYMKVVPSSLIEDKMQRKIEVPIEGDKDFEDHVTQWQEFITIKKGQEQEDPDSKVSVKNHLDTGNKFILSFVDEYAGYMWIYRMKNKDEMSKVIEK